MKHARKCVPLGPRGPIARLPLLAKGGAQGKSNAAKQ
jgi:hypothetical protein